MFINCKELIDGDSLVKIYNLFEDPISGVRIYLTSEIYDVYEKALLFGITVTIDNQSYLIDSFSKGVSSINPIIYSRPVSGCKLKLHNEMDDLIGLIVGSDGSSQGSNWVKGFNSAHLDDSINLKIDWTRIVNPVLLKYISDNLIIVITPEYFKHVRPGDEWVSGDGDPLPGGYGLSSWGGIVGSNLEGYGG